MRFRVRVRSLVLGPWDMRFRYSKARIRVRGLVLGPWNTRFRYSEAHTPRAQQ